MKQSSETCCICGTTQDMVPHEKPEKYPLCAVCLLTDGLFMAWLDSRRNWWLPALLVAANTFTSVMMACQYVDDGGKGLTMFCFVVNALVAYYFSVELRKIIHNRKKGAEDVYMLLLRGPTGDDAEILKRLHSRVK